MAQQLRPTLGVSPSKETFVSNTSSHGGPTTHDERELVATLSDLDIPKRSEKRQSSSISSIPPEVLQGLIPQSEANGLDNCTIVGAAKPKSVLKNSSNASLGASASQNKIYSSQSTAENTRLNALNSSSSVNLAQPVSTSSSITSSKYLTGGNPTARRPSALITPNERSQPSRSTGPGPRDPRLKNSNSTAAKRQQQLVGTTQQPASQNHHLAAATIAAQQHDAAQLSPLQNSNPRYKINAAPKNRSTTITSATTATETKAGT
ncbi:unnamed protein product [Ambrosiozyma monospora]|uniref:Unnamed protein product n=1 Tax=Ambrosiozyma monospora TaxID=43982 RepID=A0ACB5U9W6_AMBMO|nr:unnamed protein product [Ambrosiozyma monospora]